MVRVLKQINLILNYIYNSEKGQCQCKNNIWIDLVVTYIDSAIGPSQLYGGYKKGSKMIYRSLTN